MLERSSCLVATRNKFSCCQRRQYWVHIVNQKRETFGESHRLRIELKSHDDRFSKYFRMSRESFEELHKL
ncbi:hypothetical protein PR048_021011 [Dryococelus australis]|uniref:Uncharacterized protein n=1 Tax=Dryococelus australis TaxID=614101 RepID=A0ABQ9GX12_9NEOP|nr:hypothetical protein PR048_021011 [Dryococelus australis]